MEDLGPLVGCILVKNDMVCVNIIPSGMETGEAIGKGMASREDMQPKAEVKGMANIKGGWPLLPIMYSIAILTRDPTFVAGSCSLSRGLGDLILYLVLGFYSWLY